MDIKKVAEEVRIPINKIDSQYFVGLPTHVSIPVMCEEQCQKNLGESLTECAAGYGMDWSEVFSVLEFREWRPMNIIEIVDGCRKYHFID